jgi:hypothetical protein
MKKALFKFNVDLRGGCLKGLFIATQEEVDAIIGKTVYFGEVIGKHTDYFRDIEEADIIKITDDETVIAKVEMYDLDIGYNPLDYYTCRECGDILDPITGICRALCDIYG